MIRDLAWDGCHNVRDLGGLPAAGGRRTRWGAVVRSDTPDRLTPAGWAAAAAHGVRTILDLRRPGEHRAEPGLRPPGMTVVQVSLDRPGDPDLHLYGGTPLYLGPFLERRPDRCAAALRVIAEAPPGGVLVHCVAGRDRTGLVSLLLLALAGVAGPDILADYELSAARLRPLYAKLGQPDDDLRVRGHLARAGTTTPEVIMALLDGLDVEEYLRAGGLTGAEQAALRERLTVVDEGGGEDAGVVVAVEDRGGAA
ncbi:tyrosine-protein phosphatase [Nonomuraea jiangxiensis]|uniref:Protein tyrosine/serine phosphatase n=1 Tax=Nonomuraea jiangxiensis TaxID=633440 RepID=A0A1G7YXV9_9ACTN|nr:tyrosine-protein phosphatase [Nonomuraea jiangxiensis]SDH01378.1 Protein tyrosine/serine phosphatase [Nonomuraea jiangxiensis]